MSSNGYVMMLIPPCRNTIMQMLWHNHNLFRNSLCFQIEASSTPETKIFSKLDLLFPKSHPFFDLRLLKKIGDHYQKSPNGALTWNPMIWLKRFIFTIWLSKRVARLRPFSGKTNSLKIMYLKKIHFFQPLNMEICSAGGSRSQSHVGVRKGWVNEQRMKGCLGTRAYVPHAPGICTGEKGNRPSALRVSGLGTRKRACFGPTYDEALLLKWA